MPLLPPRNYSDVAANILLDVKKGSKQALGDFVWQHQERFYCIAFMATEDPEIASQLTMQAFKDAFAALKQSNAKQLSEQPVWDWMSHYIVDAIAQYHEQSSTPMPHNSQTDPSLDGSGQMDWETTVILGTQRVKRCINSLSAEQKKAFVLRHQLGLSFKQVVAVLNQHPDNVMAWLHRGRVQVVKCLGRG